MKKLLIATILLFSIPLFSGNIHRTIALQDVQPIIPLEDPPEYSPFHS